MFIPFSKHVSFYKIRISTEIKTPLTIRFAFVVHRTRTAVHLGDLEPGDEQTQEQIRECGGLRPQPGCPADAGKHSGVGLHQRQLLRRIPKAECLHRDAGPTARHVRRLLEDGLGAEELDHRDAHQTGGERKAEGKLMVRMFSLLLS